MKQDIDWRKVQKFYDENGSYDRISKEFGLSSATISKASKTGLLKILSKSEAGKRRAKNSPRKMSEESKAKISKARKEFLKNNPDKVPYLLNHYSNGDSYPEKYFAECLKESTYIKKVRLHTYQLDFADEFMGIDLEIDGDQHYLDLKIVEHDKKRNTFLIEKGWKVVRVNWSQFQKLSRNEKEEIIKSIIEKKFHASEVISLFGFDQSIFIPIESLAKRKEKRVRKALIAECSRKKVISWPNKEELEKLVWSKSVILLAKDMGVSDMAIRAKCKREGIKVPPIGYWARIAAGYSHEEALVSQKKITTPVKKITEDDIKIAKDLLAQGFSVRKIGKKLGFSHTVIGMRIKGWKNSNN